MIEKRSFEIKNVLDETIHFEFKKDGVQETIWTKDKKPITLRSFIDRNINNAEIFPQYAELKSKYETIQADYQALLLEHQELKEKYNKFEKNIGKGRPKGSYKLNNEQIKEVLKLYGEGISKRQIASKFKVDEKTIRNIIKREYE